LLLVMNTEVESTVATAPPHAEHAIDVFRHVAVLFSNDEFVTIKTLEMAPTAPPVWAKLLKNAQLVTATVLEMAARAPPVPLKASKLAQF
jgi:hypothetical protein